MIEISWTHYQNWLQSLLLQAAPPFLAPPLPEEITTNSRTVTPGSWFLPLKGEKYDGHDFIGEALSNGARGFFYRRDKQHEIPQVLLTQGVAVSDTKASLQKIANGWRKAHPHLTVFALTGSVGKTTCKEFLAHILSANASTHYSRGNLNTEIGLPLSLLHLKEKHRFSVLEMGARHPGDIAELISIAEPDVVACLNVHPVHLASFGSLKAILTSKLEIIAPQPRANKACIFADQEALLSTAKTIRQDLITFGTHPDAVVRLSKVTWLENGGMSLAIAYGRRTLELELELAHESYPINLTAACALAYGAGIKGELIVSAIKGFRGIPGRYFITKLKELTVVDDAYNANPESMAAGLRSLIKSYPQRPKIVILGDMLEMGSAAINAHQNLGRFCQETTHPSLLITVGDLAYEIGKGAIASGLADQRHLHYNRVEELIAANLPLKTHGEIIYVKASRGMQLDRYVSYLVAGAK